MCTFKEGAAKGGGGGWTGLIMKCQHFVTYFTSKTCSLETPKVRGINVYIFSKSRKYQNVFSKQEFINSLRKNFLVPSARKI